MPKAFYRKWIFVLLLLAACSPRATVTRETADDTPVPTSIPTAVETPFIMPTPPPLPTSLCNGTPRQQLILQERGIVLPDDPRPVNMRREPGTDSPVVERIPVRGLFYVLEGPICEGDYAWFKVDYQGIEGWIAEGDQTSYYVAPYLPG